MATVRSGVASGSLLNETISKITPEQARDASLNVVEASLNNEDALDLLEMLGLA